MTAATEAERAKKAELLEVTHRRRELLDEYNTQLVECDGGEHYSFDPETGYPVFVASMESKLRDVLGLDPLVVGATMALITCYATKGWGDPPRCASGCFVCVVDDRARFLHRLGFTDSDPAELGVLPRHNKYGLANKPTVLDPNGAASKFFSADFATSGTMLVVDGQTGELVASRVAANASMRVPQGAVHGCEVSSLDDREAMAVAARGGALVFTCHPDHCETGGRSGGPIRMFYQAEEGTMTDDGVRVVMVPTKAPPSVLGTLGAGELEEQPAMYEFDCETHVVRYAEARLPPAAEVSFEIKLEGRGKETATGRDVINAVLAMLSWFARVGVSMHGPGRPYCGEAAKGAIVLCADSSRVWSFCEPPQYNKYAHMNAQKGTAVNVLTIFEWANEEALHQVALDLLVGGMLVVDFGTGNVVASGVTVRDLSRGTRNGSDHARAASAAALGNGDDESTLAVAVELAESDCGKDLAPSHFRGLQVFNGALTDLTAVREAAAGVEAATSAASGQDAPTEGEAAEGEATEGEATEGDAAVAAGDEAAAAAGDEAAAAAVERADYEAAEERSQLLAKATADHAAAVAAATIEAVRIPLRNPAADAVTDAEFIRLAQDGHVPGVKTFLAMPKNSGRVDGPQGVGGRRALFCAAEKGRAEVVKLLLDQGASVDLQDQYGTAALMAASNRGHADAAEMLCAAGGASVEMKNERGWTALSWASMNAHESVVRVLLAAGARDVGDEDGNTLLHKCANWGHAGVIKELLAAGGDKNATNLNGKTAKDLAKKTEVAVLL